MDRLALALMLQFFLLLDEGVHASSPDVRSPALYICAWTVCRRDFGTDLDRRKVLNVY